jgi:hypothetical protein
VGWAVRESEAHRERRQHRAESARPRNAPKILTVSLFGLWNVLGLGAFIYSIVGSGNEPTGTKHVVATVVVWLWLLGDVTLLALGILVRYLMRRGGSERT